MEIYSRTDDLKPPFLSREEMILRHMPLIRLLAYRTVHRLPRYGSPSVEDLVNAGVIGLMDALDKFDPGKKVKFQTYAEYRIKGAIVDELRSLDCASRFLRQKAKEVENAREALQKKKGRKADEEELAKELGVDLETFFETLSKVNAFSPDLREEGKSLDEAVLNFLPAKLEENPFYCMSRTEFKELLTEGIEKLPPQERLVISLYYYHELTLNEIAGIMGFTESRICQIHLKALSRMKMKMARDLAGALEDLTPSSWS